MSFFEWRRFNFFDLKELVDNARLSEILKECELTVSTSGYNQLILGDSMGQIHIVKRNWHVNTFRAYELKVTLAQQLRNVPILVTIGEDEPGVNPIIKVWDTSRLDKNGVPFCSRITRAIPNNRPVNATVLCVHENLQMMAVGFADGALVLYRGDVTRDRGSRQKLLRDSSSMVTGLAFKSTAVVTSLFVATDSCVLIYHINSKDREIKMNLGLKGCAKKCSVLAESIQESHFMTAMDDAIYCYTTDDRGPCYAVDGEKVMIEWFRSYLVIISKTNRPVNVNKNRQKENHLHTITILDIQNKFIVYSTTITLVKAIIHEWGGLYILDGQNNLHHLDEKDLQSKLSLLFKKNLYDVAIRIAKSQQYDNDGLVDIFRQYGDHLYSKGDQAGAIEQYIKTIGKLEPSYVIRKFLDSQHIEKLTSYLQAFHKQGQAGEDHTTLLLNCFTKLSKTDSLKEFILQKDRDLDFDVEAAIKVCRSGSPEEALMLAKKHKKHDWYIKLQMEDHENFRDIVEYLSTLDFNDAKKYMKKYGNILIEKAPVESTQFLKRLCTDYNQSNKSMTIDNLDVNISGYPQRADAEDYIHLFLNNSTRLVEFLEYLISQELILFSTVYDTLLEHYLHLWDVTKEASEKKKYMQKGLKLLQNPDINYDKAQALVVCHMHGFSEGILYLYEEEKLYQQILRYHMTKQDTKAVLACCRRFGHQDPTLWVQALWSCVRDTRNPPINLLPEILSVISKERLLSPQFVIEAVATAQSGITLGDVRSYILTEFKQEQEMIVADTQTTNSYKKDTEKLKEQLETLKSGSTVIQNSRCAACHHQLELPSLHFLCQHSYHQYCFQSFSENENECPACGPANKSLLDILKAREDNKDLNESFHSQVEMAEDGFSVAAEYFGRGVFNKIKVIVDKPIEKPVYKVEKPAVEVKQQPKRVESPKLNYGLGAEARMRQSENKRTSPAGIPISEGRMRIQESNRYSSSLEANITRPEPKSVESRTSSSSKSSPKGANPFDDEDDYDDDKNPFANEKDDYDKNLNPFES